MTVVGTPLTTAITPIGVNGAGDVDALWTPRDLFRHNWAGPVTLAHAWRTDASDAGDGRVTRRQERSRPIRQQSFTPWANRDEDLAALVTTALRFAHGRCAVPLWSEYARLTADVIATATVFPCDSTADRLFFPGAYVAVIEPAQGRGSAARFAIGVIDSVAANSITVTDQIGLAFPARSRIVPLMECDPLLASSFRGMGDWASGGLTFQSASARLSASALPATRARGQWPDGAATAYGFPVFDVWPQADGVAAGFRRGGDATRLHGVRALRDFDLAFKFTSRAKARRLLYWFDALRGETEPFLFLSPLRELRPPTGAVTVGGSAFLYVELFRFDSRLGPLPRTPWRIAVIERNAGQRVAHIRQVVSSQIVVGGPNDGLEEITLDTALPSISINALDRITFAVQSRLGADAYTERWRTTEVMESEIPIVEDLDSAPIAIGVPDPCAPVEEPEGTWEIIFVLDSTYFMLGDYTGVVDEFETMLQAIMEAITQWSNTHNNNAGNLLTPITLCWGHPANPGASPAVPELSVTSGPHATQAALVSALSDWFDDVVDTFTNYTIFPLSDRQFRLDIGGARAAASTADNIVIAMVDGFNGGTAQENVISAWPDSAYMCALIGYWEADGTLNMSERKTEVQTDENAPAMMPGALHCAYVAPGTWDVPALGVDGQGSAAGTADFTDEISAMDGALPAALPRVA